MRLAINHIHRLLALIALVVSAAALHAQAIPVKACAVLHAHHAAPIAQATPDTARIQSALSLCLPGEAVALESDGQNNTFTSAPLVIPRGVTLFIGKGVTLFASTNPRDYDLWPASCGVIGSTHPGCKPFLFAYQAAYSGVAGPGTIDGHGAQWWPLLAKARQQQEHVSLPALVSSYESQNFSVHGLTLKNSAGTSLALYKTIGFIAQGTRIEAASGAGRGVLLSNSPDGHLSGLTVSVPGAAIDLRASILGGTKRVAINHVRVTGGTGISLGDDTYGSVNAVTIADSSIANAQRGFSFNLTGTHGGTLHNVAIQNVCLTQVAAPLQVKQSQGSIANTLPPNRNISLTRVTDSGVGTLQPSGIAADKSVSCSAASSEPPQFALNLSALSKPGAKSALTVAQNGSGDFRTIQQAVNALPNSGGSIAVKPGIYREVVTIRKPHVHLYGSSADPSATQIIFDNTGPKNGGTFNSATVFVEADNVKLDHLTIMNSAGNQGQAIALAVTADRAIFRYVRILGAQDTLFAASKYCYGDYGPCVPARQYFSDCYIAGNTDFIFGDSQAVFSHCELHGISGKGVMYTAQDRHNNVQPSGYVFDHCRLTAAPDAGRIALGRPWRPHAAVVYLNTQIDAPVIPAGWLEWPRFGVPSLPTAFYAEYNSTGPGADPSAREQHAHLLTAAEAARWNPARFLAGTDNWNPIPHDTERP